MSLLSKLIGKKAGETTKELLNGLLNGKASQDTPAYGQFDPPQSAAASRAEQQVSSAPSGVSWGEVMPNEPNQYNSGLNYRDYFEQIYRTEFPDCRLEMENPQGLRFTVFTFWQGDRKALVVELLSRKSSASKRRADCRRSGTPYLRFYYDYHGWWNTRAYVIERTRKALGA